MVTLSMGIYLTFRVERFSISVKSSVLIVTSLMLLGYVNNYDKNHYLEKFPKAAVAEGI